MWWLGFVQIHWVYNTWYACFVLLRVDAFLSAQAVILASLAVLEYDVVSSKTHTSWEVRTLEVPLNHARATLGSLLA